MNKIEIVFDVIGIICGIGCAIMAAGVDNMSAVIGWSCSSAWATTMLFNDLSN